jgi:hypothetical protein
MTISNYHRMVAAGRRRLLPAAGTAEHCSPTSRRTLADSFAPVPRRHQCLTPHHRPFRKIPSTAPRTRCLSNGGNPGAPQPFQVPAASSGTMPSLLRCRFPLGDSHDGRHCHRKKRLGRNPQTPLPPTLAIPTTARSEIFPDLASNPCDGVPEKSPRPRKPQNTGPESPPTLETLAANFSRVPIPMDLLLFSVG